MREEWWGQLCTVCVCVRWGWRGGCGGSWWNLATILHVLEKSDTCDFNKAQGSYYPSYLYIYDLHKNLQPGESINSQMICILNLYVPYDDTFKTFQTVYFL